MGNLVPTVNTKATNSEMKAALSQAWTTLWDETPGDTSILVLMSHWALETGGGGSMMCWNVGNVKGRKDGSTGDYCLFKTWEILGGQRVDMVDAFLAFPDLNSGVEFYLKTLKNKFSLAWNSVIQGDPAQFAHNLKLQRYYTASESSYTSLMKSKFYFYAGEGKLTNQSDLIASLISCGFSDLKSYQAARGLTVDGIPGPISRGMLALECGL